jgi:hypothetical protein
MTATDTLQGDGPPEAPSRVPGPGGRRRGKKSASAGIPGHAGAPAGPQKPWRAATRPTPVARNTPGIRSAAVSESDFDETRSIETQEAITEARAHLWAAVKIDAGRRALEGDIESAFGRLESASGWLRRDDIPNARREIAEALDLLRTPESRSIAGDTDALNDAIRLLERVRWDD